MTKMTHKLHFNIQRLISIEFSIKNIYELTEQCQRIYESEIQINKSKRIVNKINQQKQHQIAFLNVVIFLKTFVSITFSRKILFESKSRLFNFSSNAVLRLSSKKALIFFKQKRCYKCRKFEHIIATCKSELKSESTRLNREIVRFEKLKLFFINVKKKR